MLAANSPDIEQIIRLLTPTRIKDYERLAAGSVDSVPDPGGPVRLDQLGALNLDGRGPRASSQHPTEVRKLAFLAR